MTVPVPPRPFARRLTHWVRRLHLYSGLFLLPWVLLYAVTAFLFNHPTAFSDQPYRSFGRAAVAGTPMQELPPARDTAERVVRALNEADPAAGYQLVEPDRSVFTREFAFATAKGNGEAHSILIEVASSTGTIRTATAAASPPAKSPFDGRKIAISDGAADRMKAALPEVLARRGLEAGEVTVTSVPDVAFLVRATDGAAWRATYNGMTGVVTGLPAGESAESPSARRFLTRLHLASGYPGHAGPRWYWALVVDAVSAAMVFWAASGLVMWWQVRAVRLAGGVCLLAGAALAAWLAAEMYGVFLPR